MDFWFDVKLSYCYSRFRVEICSYSIDLTDITWSSLVEGDEGSYLPNFHSNLAIALHFLYFLQFHKHNSLPLAKYEP